MKESVRRQRQNMGSELKENENKTGRDDGKCEGTQKIKC